MKVKIEDLCIYTTSGATPTSTNYSYYNPPSIPWLRTKEVNFNYIYDTEIYISEEGLRNSSTKLIPVNSVIVAMYGQGDTAGRVAINKIPLCTNQACCNLIIDPEKADYKFVFYALSNQYEELVQRKNGGAQPNLNSKLVKTLEIPLFSLEKQHRVANTLNAYDSLIENNRKQIKLLEEAAQRLYKEWFIDLRFPGYESTPIDSETGLPEGWAEISLRAALESEIGGGWGEETRSPEFSEIAYVIRATDMDDAEKGVLSGIPLRFHKASNLASRTLREGDIVFEVSGGSRDFGVGRNLRISSELLDQLPHPVMCASFCKKMRPKTSALSLVIAESIRYAFQTNGLRTFEKRSAGNIINFHWDEFLDSFKLRMPSTRLLNHYLELIGVIHKAKSKKANAIRIAREARDRLLPKLMSLESSI